MLARDEASSLIVLAALNYLLNFEDNWSQEVMKCLLNLSNHLLAGPVRDVGKSTHLRSWFTFLALMIILNVLRWFP